MSPACLLLFLFISAVFGVDDNSTEKDNTSNDETNSPFRVAFFDGAEKVLWTPFSAPF